MNVSDTRKEIISGIIISLSTLFAYWNIQYNNLIGYDDVKYLIENEYVRTGLSIDSARWAFTATYDANWFPLTWLSHMLDMSLFGSKPLGHHLESLFLHIANALLLLHILNRLTGHVWRSTSVALLFALHPLHVESVAWIAERKDVLSTLFFLLTVIFYIEYVKRETGYQYWIAILLYACGLMSKPMLVSLPFILILLDFWPLQRIYSEIPDSKNRKSGTFLTLLIEKVPFVLLSLVSCIVTLNVQKNGGGTTEIGDQSLIDNSLHAFLNLSTYLRKTFWPSDLGVIYPYVNDIPTWVTAGSATMVIGFSLVAVIARKRMPYVSIGWFWFLVTMGPVSGIIKVGVHSVTDRYTYIPLIGIFIIVVWFLSDILSGKRYATRILATILVAILIPLTVLTWKQTTYWKDSITLFKHTLGVTENNWVAHNNLGAELLKYFQIQEAEWHIREAIRINPASESALFNLGQVLNRQGDQGGAIRAFLQAIKLNPTHAEAYFEAGSCCFQIGEKVSAYEILNKLKGIDQNMADSLQKQFILIGDGTPANRS